MIGVKYDVPPFGLNNPRDRRGRGLRRRPRQLHRRASSGSSPFREATSDNRIPLLVDGTIDLILSTMTITEERDLEIDFSEPYYVANGDVLVPDGLRHPGARRPQRQQRVCTALGSTYAETIKKEAPDAELRLVDLYSECFDQVQTGAVDAVSTDNVILTGMVIQDDTLEMLDLDYTTEPYGIGIPDGRRGVQAVRRRGARRVHRLAAPGRRPTTSGSASTSPRTSSRARPTSPSRRRWSCSRWRSSGTDGREARRRGARERALGGARRAPPGVRLRPLGHVAAGRGVARDRDGGRHPGRRRCGSRRSAG